jgi:hypothetical protein
MLLVSLITYVIDHVIYRCNLLFFFTCYYVRDLGTVGYRIIYVCTEFKQVARSFPSSGISVQKRAALHWYEKPRQNTHAQSCDLRAEMVW